MKTGSSPDCLAQGLAVLLAVILTATALRAQESASPRLADMTDATFSRWLTGMEWKGAKDGKGAHLWFATPGIVIVRWEFNPGVWDCRAAAVIPGGKGKLKWRWNPDAVASCTCAAADDLKSLTIEDGLLGKWSLAPSSRKAAAVMGGKLSTMGAAGFSAWLEKQSLLWRTDKLNFGKGRTAFWDVGAKGTFEIISPGVVEAFPTSDRSNPLLIMFTPALEAALIYGHWGVTGAKVKGAPATAVVPVPLFNDPEPACKTLAAMKKEDFEKWLVGTEWEHTENNYTSWYWHAAPSFITWRGGDQHYGFGSEISDRGKVIWKFRADEKALNTFTANADLSGGEYVWDNGNKRCRTRLIARRMPFPMNAPTVEQTKQMVVGSKVPLGDDALTFPAPDLTIWHWKNGKTQDRILTFPGPGMFRYTVSNAPADSSLFIIKGEGKIRQYWMWGAAEQKLVPASQDGNMDVAAGGLFDMGLNDTKAIPVKNPTVSVNALVVMDLGGGRTAGALSKLSLTSLALTKEDVATVAFNQPVGADMKKALREVTRFHAIRQQGWPRGQKMELSFADKYSPKDGPSAAVACALLLESALRGVALQPDFAITGDMNADGSVQPIGGVAAKLRGATKGGCKVAAVPDKNITEVTDLALTDGAAPFLGIQVFSISHFDDAVKLAVRDDPALRAVCDSFTVIAGKIKAAPAALRLPDTIAALRNLSRQAPTHLSALLLLALAEDKLPPALSPPGSLNAIELAITDALEGTSQELLAKSNLDRGKVSSARGKLQQLRGKLDKRTHPLTDAWVAWCQSVERITTADGKVDGKTAKEHNATVKRINAEEEKLRANADFREDLMR